jgi:SAM-dependent methyltransferase
MHQGTRDTYNHSAGQLGKHYDEIGPREGDIDLAFAIAGYPENAVVLEIGCGNGRDARAILRHTPFYTGIDTSEKMIALARIKAPKGVFEVADAVLYDYAGPYDIVFALAQFRHMNIEEAATVLKKVYDSLKPGGVFYISSNYGEQYHQSSRADSYGLREMYYYNPAIIQQYAPEGFKKIQEIHDVVDGNQWFEIALKKQKEPQL